MKKKVLTAVLAGALSASMVVPAFAGSTSEGGAIPTPRGTEVMAGVMLKDPDAKVKVEVPTLFAFVVNGSVSTADAGAVTSDNGGIMLPNMKVTVTKPSGALGAAAGDSNFNIETQEDAVMKFTNYSTVRNKDFVAAGDKAPRVGLDVKVNGFIENRGDAVSRNYWEHIANAKTLEADTTGFKKYTISINGEEFSVGKDGGFVMANPIELGAPDLGWDWDPTGGTSGTGAGTYTNLNETSLFAETGITKDATFGVAVGGQKNQYKQVEQSAKVGTIVWTISAEVKETDIYTAPENEYLDGVGNLVDPGSATDTDPDSAIELD